VTTTTPEYTLITYDAGGNVTANVTYEEITVTGTEEVLVTTTTSRAVEFMPGITYYWRTRVSGTTYGPLISPWSEARSFTVSEVAPPPAPVVKLELQAPAHGATNVPLKPTFAWTAVEGAVTYTFVVATDSAFTNKMVDKSAGYSLTTNVYELARELEYSTTYYWQVTPCAAAKGAKAMLTPVVGIFSTMAEPVAPQPPVVIKEVAPSAPVEVPEAIPQWMLLTIIGIGAVLVIALIVLIVRTRRVA